jgi:diguanylate cyclase (GGDEF)-like protein/PAS domain S-box-containing protein
VGFSDDTARKIQELASLFEHNADAVVVFDRNGFCVGANPAAERLGSVGADELTHRSYLTFVAPDTRHAARAAFRRVIGGESFATDSAIVDIHGERIEVNGTAVPIVVDGAVAGAYFIGSDVTEKRRLEAAVREQTERVRELYLVSASPSGSAETQIAAALAVGCRRLRCAAGYVTRVDRGLVRYLYAYGSPLPGPGNEPVDGSLHRLVLEAREPLAIESLRRGDVRAFIGVPISIEDADFGTLSLVSTQQSASFGEADRDFVGLIGGLVASIIERQEQRRRAELLAFYDPLTELPNRTLLYDRLAQAIAGAERHSTVFAVHFYDLDDFKTVNDSHGHLRGDEVLRIVARRLERAARAEDTVARLGGDEFVVLQPVVNSRADVEALSARFTAALEEPLVVGGTAYRMSASVGVAIYPSDGRDVRTLLARADAALYRVKTRGGNGIEFVSPPE